MQDLFSVITPAFIAATLVLLLIPGPAVLYIVTRSVAQGRLAGLTSTIGVGIGSLAHVAAAALGLSAILVSSAEVFRLVKWAGAAYLMYLGWRTLRSADAGDTAEVSEDSLRVVFRQGVIVNALNPKLAVFFFAFLPQFVQPEVGRVAAQFTILGITLVVIGLITDSVFAVVAGSVSGWLKAKRSALRKASGGILVLLGVTAAVS